MVCDCTECADGRMYATWVEFVCNNCFHTEGPFNQASQVSYDCSKCDGGTLEATWIEYVCNNCPHTKFGAESFETESLVEEPDWIPDGDGRALGQQNLDINLSPLHAEQTEYHTSNVFYADEDEAPLCEGCGRNQATVKWNPLKTWLLCDYCLEQAEEDDGGNMIPMDEEKIHQAEDLTSSEFVPFDQITSEIQQEWDETTVPVAADYEPLDEPTNANFSAESKLHPGLYRYKGKIGMRKGWTECQECDDIVKQKDVNWYYIKDYGQATICDSCVGKYNYKKDRLSKGGRHGELAILQFMEQDRKGAESFSAECVACDNTYRCDNCAINDKETPICDECMYQTPNMFLCQSCSVPVKRVPIGHRAFTFPLMYDPAYDPTKMPGFSAWSKEFAESLKAESVGSPSPTFNEGITGQDGPSAEPTL